MNTHTAPVLPLSPPAGRWGMNHLSAMRKDYLGFTTHLQRQHPDIAYIKILNEHVTHVFHPDWVREVLGDQANAHIHRERSTEVFSMSMGQGVLVAEGGQWQRLRRMLQPGFTPKRVAGYARLMAASSRQVLDRLPQQRDESSVDAEALMTRVTLNVILSSLFGQHQVDDPQAVADAIHTISHYGIKQLFKPFSWPMWLPLPSVRKARKALQVLDELINQHILIHQSNDDPKGEDLLTMFRLARDPDQPNQGLSAKELHDQTIVMFQAGHETTATALTWWCGLIAQHPQVADRIHAEVDAVLKEQDPTPDKLSQMPWLQASLKEALRLYPPAAILFTRRACEDLTVGPWTVPKGHLIALTPYAIQRDPRWFESPDEFRPERFLPNAPDIPRGAWIPFGTGPRVCIGQHFAMLEMGLIAAMLLQRFRLKWPPGASWPKGDLIVTLRPASPMKLQLEPRKPMR